MEVIRTVRQMQAYADAQRTAGRRIALVPTMGFLHAGHVSLMHLASKHADTVVVSIFVNPMQFGPGEDYETYPRDWERDVQRVGDAGVDVLFAPDAGEMYPDGFQTTVSVARLTKHLCGASRPTHFDGVTTVVAKLFTCTKPHCAVFGQKDYQQLAVIRRMVVDLNLDVDIIPAPIVREQDGVAMSSRNTYLTPEERSAARSLSQALLEVQQLVERGQRNTAALIAHAAGIITAAAPKRIDYIKVCDAETLEECSELSAPAVMALAVCFGKARLIDNIVLNAAQPNDAAHSR